MKKSKRGGRRHGAGRPLKYSGDKCVEITVSVPASLAATLAQTAADNQLSRSELITFILRHQKT